MGLYTLGISYVRFCCYIRKDIRGWFSCVIIAEDIFELWNDFSGAAVLCLGAACAVNRLYLYRTRSQWAYAGANGECDIAKYTEEELRAPVLVLFFFPLVSAFYPRFHLLMQNRQLFDKKYNKKKIKNTLNRLYGLSPEKRNSPISSLREHCVFLLHSFQKIILNICFKDVSLSHNKMGWTGVYNNLAVRRRHSVGSEAVS